MLESLTDKQVEVLDQLCLHKTSKEIANELGISRHTVDQRVSSVRTKWNLPTRQEVVRLYRELRETAENRNDSICEPLIYEPSQVGIDAEADDPEPKNRTTSMVEDLAPAALAAPGMFQTNAQGMTLVDHLDLRFGPSGRFVAVIGLAFMMALTLALVLVIADALERLL
ncbi:helix-turn-helix transcriptional regulator [Novosphingobium sp. PP1Y]|uniref:helix-turn-helix transcriptional regulator n=1 Tax=Novosphingobium sp. PP1Y TaxID=702113 RepID=UPI00031C7150|nr:helix-turn-helix transcriptional regulator [Novosphingobium sp. PP1Y]